jgi:hypothetical protein
MSSKMCKEQERVKRLGNEDFWQAVDVGFAQWRDARRPVAGDYRCPKCEKHYDPTYNPRGCPHCGQGFVGAPDDWPTEADVRVIEARHRGPQLEAVSWNSGPVLFDSQRDDYVGL